MAMLNACAWLVRTAARTTIHRSCLSRMRLLLVVLLLFELRDSHECGAACTTQLCTVECVRVIALWAAEVDATRLTAKPRTRIPALAHIALVALHHFTEAMLSNAASHSAQRLLLQLPI